MEEKKVPALRFRGFDNAWEQRRLDDICEIVTKQTGFDYSATIKPSLVKECLDDTYPFIQNKDFCGDSINMNTDFFVPISIAEKFTKILLDKPSILISISGRIGNVGFYNINRKALIGGAVGICKLKNPENGDFIIQELESVYGQKYFQALTKASSHSNITVEDIRNIRIIFPKNKREIKKISELFKSLDHLISLHQRKLEMLKKVKKSMLEKMFPKNDAKVPELRFSDFTDAWEQCKLGEVVKEVTRNDSASEAPIMMITANHGFIEQSERYAFNNAGESLKRYILLEKGELAYNHGASKLRPYGSCFALTTAENARIPFVYHCFSAEEQNAEFISIELNGSGVENQLCKIVSSGARMDGLLNISFAEYTSVSVLLPKIEEQNRIADFFRNLDNLISLHQRKLEKLKNIKKSMLEKMFII